MKPRYVRSSIRERPKRSETLPLRSTVVTAFGAPPLSRNRGCEKPPASEAAADPPVRDKKEQQHTTPQKHRPGKTEKTELLQMSDEALMARLQAGETEAFDILLSRYEAPIVHYLSRFLGNRDKAQDLLQETFLRMYRHRDAYQPIAKFSTWLYTIAGNLARSEYRRLKRRPMLPFHTQSPEGEEQEIQVPGETVTPDRYTEGIIQDRHIQRALEQLPEEFREAVVLRDVQQLSYEEIAEITGLPTGTVKSRINRGRTRLQELLKDVYIRQEH